MIASYDEGRISFITAEISEAIEQASLGRIPWTSPAEIFSAAFPGGFAALIVKRPVLPPLMEDLSAFQQLFGLTKAEARLSLSVSSGRTLREAAVELGLSYETVRTSTKAIFAKTGTRSQSAFCDLLARYAA